MITLKSAHEIELMRRAGKITAAARALAREMVKPGVTTHQIDKAVFDFIRSHGATPSFLHYNGYPASVCVSVNDEIIHGIPGPRVLQEGDVVSVDVGAYIGGVHGDCAGTYPCGKVSDEDMDLIRVTQESFFQGLKYAREGYRLSDISAAVQQYAESHGYSIVREYVGHGIGHHMHEPPVILSWLPLKPPAMPPTENGAGWRTPSESDGSIRSFAGRATARWPRRSEAAKKSPIVSFVKP